jgi:hypothetical protein
LYLADEMDLDRSVAIEKGFRPWNLLAVNRDEKIVKEIRKQGGVAVCGDIGDIICAWPEHLSLDVIHADFCCGLTKSLGGFIHAVLTRPTDRLLVCVNLLRGRDAWSNEWRDACRDALDELSLGDKWRSDMGGGTLKHRAQMFFVLLSCTYHTVMAYNHKRRFTDVELWELNEYHHRYETRCLGSWSYKGKGNMILDSALYLWDVRETVCSKYEEDEWLMLGTLIKGAGSKDLQIARRRLAAWQARRTMNGYKCA